MLSPGTYQGLPGGYTWTINPDQSVTVAGSPDGRGVGTSYAAGSPVAQRVYQQVLTAYPEASADVGPPAPQAGGGAPPWLQTVTGVADQLLPLVPSVVQAVEQGRRNTPAALAGKIARKQGELARARSAAKRARLQAEIAALLQQQAQYQQVSAEPLPAAPPEPRGIPTWVWIAGIGAVIVIGGALVVARR